MRTKTALLLVSFFFIASLWMSAVPPTYAGLGGYWWTPDHISYHVPETVGTVKARVYDMWWSTNDYDFWNLYYAMLGYGPLSYVQEFRTDYTMLEGNGWYYTDLPGIITYTNADEDEEQDDGYEEIEVIAQEPTKIQTYTCYEVAVKFNLLAEGDNYMAFEGELGIDNYMPGYPDYPLETHVYGTRTFYQEYYDTCQTCCMCHQFFSDVASQGTQVMPLLVLGFSGVSLWGISTRRRRKRFTRAR
jgi:hypothetical protein